ncbi:hypothetical protein AgCh_037846 [Apium graveolens]
MLFSSEIESLHHDGFEGSETESRTSRKVYFGNNGGRGTKRCLVTGVINFEHGYRKHADMLLCSNSGNSAITSQEDPLEIKEDSEEKSEPPPHVSEKLGQAKGDPNVKVKRTKLSVNNSSDAKSYIQNGLSTSAPFQEVVSDLPQSASPFLHHTVMCRIVESARHGVSCSCYLLKKHREMNLCGYTNDNDNSMCKLSSIDGSEQKEFEASKAIGSPVSQESSAAKLLVASPDINASDSGCCQPLKRRWSKSCYIELDEAEMSLRREIKNDPRPLLRYYINRLLKASGWVVGRRIRSNNGRGGYIYKLPEGKPIREFCRAWVLCGQNLFIASKTALHESDVKQWIDLSQFWSDLNDTSAKIEEIDNWEATSTLAYCWHLLDPFARVVFIDKLFGSLKAGKMILARRSLLFDPKRSNDAILTLESVANARDLLGVQQAKDLHRGRGSSFVSDRASVAFNETNVIEQDQYLQTVSVETPKSAAYILSKEKFGRNINCREISGNETSTLALLSLQAYGSDSSSDQIGNNLFQVPIKKPRRPRIKDGNRKKKSLKCRLNDNDLLISAIIKSRSCKSITKLPKARKFSCRTKSFKKYKNQKGSYRVLSRSFSRSGMHHMEAKCSPSGSRTVLSWLINSGIISLNEVIQYRNTKDDTVVKDGLVTWEGILCRCCDTVLSVSEFKFHAGFRLNCPCLNLFMESGKPFTLCQLEAWSEEYKARKNANQTVQVDESDENDDNCGLCGGEGELICCDSCPSTFHRVCLNEQEIPEGNWYCSRCTCQICGDVVDDKKLLISPNSLTCSQCEHKYHETCLKVKGIKEDEASDNWFCGKECYKVYSGLHSLVGLMNLISDGISWTLLRCIHGDKKVHSAPRFVALKAVCNIKLAVALTVMEECFLPMFDARTGIDMVPHILYNWGSQFARLDYHGFYTVILEKNDVVLSVASIRIHGTTVAEMPLIATCNRYRRQGMCRRLMYAIEKMLRSINIDKLVMSAVPALVETWTEGFGFERLEDDERRAMRRTANLMVFPGTVWLQKSLCRSEVSKEQQTGECYASPSKKDSLGDSKSLSEGGHVTRTATSEKNLSTDKVGVKTELVSSNGNNIQMDKDQIEGLDAHFSQLSFEEKEENNQLKVSGVNSVQVYLERGHTKQLEKSNAAHNIDE